MSVKLPSNKFHANKLSNSRTVSCVQIGRTDRLGVLNMHFVRLKTHVKRKEVIRCEPNIFNDKGNIHKDIFNTMPPDCKPVPKQLLEYKRHGRREPGRPLSIRKDNFNIDWHFTALLVQLRLLLIIRCILQRVIGVIPPVLQCSL
jgi:hypothetical protein